MDKKIENILSLYENILTNKSLIISEADIRGIDELVYNPATKGGGTIGHGYNDGKRVEGINWSGHDNHLHIGFTDRKTAMNIIDKADAIGLITSENPYAKKDPNGKVDNVHSQGSLHYKNFPGRPVVGMAVDISGNPKKITQLINWIETTYAGNVSKLDSTDSTDSSSISTERDEDPVLHDIITNIGQSIFSENLNESMSFGKNIKNNYGKILIPKDFNDKIKSPVSGVVDNSRYSSSCKNQIIIKTGGKSTKYLQFCGISNPSVKDGEKISSGQMIGRTDSDVEVSLFNSSFKRENINIEKTSIDYDEEDAATNIDRTVQRYDDPVLASLVKLPFKPFQDKYGKDGKRIEKRIGYGTDKKDVDPWILNLFKNKKIEENIKRIKNLL